MVIPSPMPLPAGQIPLTDTVMGDAYPRFSLATSTSSVFAGDGTIAPNIPLGGGAGMSVKNFGAKGDGITDDTAAIGVANALLATSVGGTLFFPKGTYLVSKIVVNARVNYNGEGRGNTVIKLIAGSTTNVMEGANFATLTGTTSDGGPAEYTITNLTIDGNKANCPSGGRGIAIYGPEFIIENVNVQNCHGDGIYLEFRGPSSTRLDQYVILDECYCRNLKIQSCDGNGLWVFGLHDSTFMSVNGGFNGTGSGSAVGGVRTENSGCHFVACHMYGTQQDYAWNLRGENFLVDCVGEGAATSQFFNAFKKCNIVGGKAYFPGDTSSSAITFGSGSDDVNIDGMFIELNNGTHGDFNPAIDFTNCGVRLKLKCVVSQATNAAYSGTTPTDALLEIMVRGGSTTPSLYQRPGDESLLARLPQVITDNFTASDATAPDSTKWTRTLGSSTGTSLQVLTNRMKFIAGNAGSFSVNDDVSIAGVLGSSPIDGELLFSIYVGDVTHESYFQAGLRCSGATPLHAVSGYLVSFDTSSGGVQNFHVSKRVASATTQLFSTGGTLTPLIATSKVWVRFRVRGTRIQMRFWNDGTSEPSAWAYDATDSSVSAAGLAAFALSGGAAGSLNPFQSLDEAYVFAL